MVTELIGAQGRRKMAHTYQTGQKILGADQVRLSDGTLGAVIIPGAERSLIEFRDERDWFDNNELTLIKSPKTILAGLLTAEDVAAQLHVSSRRVRALAANRGVGTQMLNGWVFTAEDVELLKPDPKYRRKS
jgi:hypothetical protein